MCLSQRRPSPFELGWTQSKRHERALDMISWGKRQSKYGEVKALTGWGFAVEVDLSDADTAAIAELAEDSPNLLSIYQLGRRAELSRYWPEERRPELPLRAWCDIIRSQATVEFQDEVSSWSDVLAPELTCPFHPAMLVVFRHCAEDCAEIVGTDIRRFAPLMARFSYFTTDQKPELAEDVQELVDGASWHQLSEAAALIDLRLDDFDRLLTAMQCTPAQKIELATGFARSILESAGGASSGPAGRDVWSRTISTTARVIDVLRRRTKSAD
jgi:hypothetical protein